MRIDWKKAWWMFAATVLGTAVVVLVPFNFTRSEKTIERSIEHEYTVQQLQFRREMGVLPGPGITQGSLVKALDNGEEIFPVMLVAFRGAERTINFETYIYRPLAWYNLSRINKRTHRKLLIVDRVLRHNWPPSRVMREPATERNPWTSRLSPTSPWWTTPNSARRWCWCSTAPAA